MDPKRSEPSLMCRIKYHNTLPEIPFPPKFLQFPSNEKRFANYRENLESKHKHKLIANGTVNCSVDLLNEHDMTPNRKAVLDEKDRALLQDIDDITSQRSRGSGKVKNHETNIPWLHKPEYMLSEKLMASTRPVPTESKVTSTNKKPREQQIEAIEQTFSDCKVKPRHPVKTHLQPIDILPIFPDFKGWYLNLSQVVFDSDSIPTQWKVPESQVDDFMSFSLLKGQLVEGDKEESLGYFVPKEETMLKRKRFREAARDNKEEEEDSVAVDVPVDEEFHYRLARDYNYKMATQEDNFVFFIRNGDGVYYNELKRLIRLTKKRAKKNISDSKELTANHRQYNDDELNNQDERLQALSHLVTEDEATAATTAAAEPSVSVEVDEE